ncbi:ufm1-specific protease 2 [Cylas formicarius]|uniref:ufm1-specific protease 2 n=1 Tax=Cylas formicarius TaxID=197179 RepID=UPI0029587868|nr:ufm1-specific protease 2 [Cylas formicarius]
MRPQIKISEITLKRLENIGEPCFGKIYGIMVKNTILIVGLEVDVDNEPNFIYSFPAEVDLYGVFEVYSDHFHKEEIVARISRVDVTDNPIFISLKLGAINEVSFNLVSSNKIEHIQFIVTPEQEINTDFAHIRLKGEFCLNTCQDREKLSKDLQQLRKTVASGAIAFTFNSLNVILVANDNENGIIGLTGDPSFGEVCDEANIKNEGIQKKKKNLNNNLEIVDMRMLKKVTSSDPNSENTSHSPVVAFNRRPGNLLNLNIKIDFLAMIHKKTNLSKMYGILLECAIRNLRLYESALQEKVKQGVTGPCTPETTHFYPKECGHFITRINFHEPEHTQRIQREVLHKTLLLSTDRPIFRKNNQFVFKKNQNNGPLICPHEGVKLTDNGGKISIVRGKYEYYHYCQNKIDDNGWGCAYRSLQTLASWYKHQGYTDKEVPTFKDIQKCLVEIGDKPPSFIDSRQWIGSTEVSFVLDSLLGVTSRILFVSSGDEMGSKGPELVNHFEVHGSPVMIGGGVLAHTILGVDYNQQTGTLKFLILDPHYTGAEDLHIIQSKGWCGWKGVDFWDKSAYYNMCLPQVPREI